MHKRILYSGVVVVLAVLTLSLLRIGPDVTSASAAHKRVTVPAPRGVPTQALPACPNLDWLVPIYADAKAVFKVPWSVLASINYLHNSFGCDPTSNPGVPWLPFTDVQWDKYGIDGGQNGYADASDPADAIFTLAFYLDQHGGADAIRRAVYDYGRSRRYVRSVFAHARRIREACVAVPAPC